jgi:hypothetical protein
MMEALNYKRRPMILLLMSFLWALKIIVNAKDSPHDENPRGANFFTMSISHFPCKTSYSRSKDSSDQYEEEFDEFGKEEYVGVVQTDCDEFPTLPLDYAVEHPFSTPTIHVPVPSPVDVFSNDRSTNTSTKLPLSPMITVAQKPVQLLITERPSVRPTLPPNDFFVSTPTDTPVSDKLIDLAASTISFIPSNSPMSSSNGETYPPLLCQRSV